MARSVYRSIILIVCLLLGGILAVPGVAQVYTIDYRKLEWDNEWASTELDFGITPWHLCWGDRQEACRHRLWREDEQGGDHYGVQVGV